MREGIGLRILVLLAAIGGLGVAGERLYAWQRMGLLVVHSGHVENGGRLSLAAVAALDADPLIRSGDVGCAFSRDLVSVRLGTMDALRSVSARRNAEAAIERALHCRPTDGNLWLRRAMIGAEEGRTAPGVHGDLELSIRFAPAEGWVLAVRKPFLAALVNSGRSEFSPLLVRDTLSALAAGTDGAVITTYLMAGRLERQVLKEPLAAMMAGRGEAAAQMFDVAASERPL